MKRALPGYMSHIAAELGRVKALVLVDCAASLVVSSLSFVPALLLKYLIDTAIPRRDGRAVLLVSLSMVLCPVLIRTLSVASVWTRMKSEHDVSMKLKARVLHAYLNAPLEQTSGLSSGPVLTTISSDASALVNGLLTMFHSVCNCTYSLVIAAFLLWRTSPLICLAVLVATVVRYPLVRVRVSILRQMTSARQNWQSRLNRAIADTVIALTTIKVHSLEQTMEDLFVSLVDKEHGDRLGFQRKLNTCGMGEATLGWLVPATVYAYGGFLTMAGRTTLGAVVAATQYMGRGIESLSGLLDLVSETRVLSVHYHNVEKFLNLPAEDESDSSNGFASIATVEICCGTYCYPDRLSAVLSQIDLSLAIGCITGLNGPSGSGKTTLATILSGIRELSSGSFIVNGSPLRHPGRSYRKHVALVTDGEFIFAGTFRENLLAVRPEATEDDIREALSLSVLDEVVDESPSGLDTLVGQGGVALSTGQKQRLSLARAILRDPDLIVLDEVTSGLDIELEDRLISKLEGWLRKRISLIISHRPSTLRMADTCIHLDERGNAVCMPLLKQREREILQVRST